MYKLAKMDKVEQNTVVNDDKSQETEKRNININIKNVKIIKNVQETPTK